MRYGNDTLVFSPELDDRLGAYLILDYLPAIGIVADVLLTDHEEIGQTTARDFEPSKHYNAIVELDRGGTDAVFYQYGGGDLEERASDFFPIGNGSHSDISGMEHCGCECVNVGIGFNNAHTEWCNASLGTVRKQMSALADFLTSIDGEVFPYEPQEYEYMGDDSFSRGDYWRDLYDGGTVCPSCLREVREVSDTERGPMCVWCGEILDRDTLLF